MDNNNNNNYIYIDYQNMQQNLNLLENQCTYIEDTYQSITKCFNELKNAQMQGETANILSKICDEWDKINNNRLQEIKTIHNIINKSLNEYLNFYNEINSRVGEVNDIN